MTVQLPEALEVKFCGREDLGALMHFIEKSCRRDHIFTKDTELFRWLNYDAAKGRYNFAIVRDKITGEIHSVLGATPHRHYDAGLPDMDVALHVGKVRDESRGQAFGRVMYSFLLTELKPRSVYLSGITPRAKDVMGRLGMTTGTLNHFYLVNSRLNRFLLLQNYDVPHFQKGVSSSNKSLRPLPDLNAIPCSNQVPGKSAGYFQRRYLDHPRYRYQLFALNDGAQAKAVCVLRLVTSGQSRMLKLVDYFGEASALSGTHHLWQHLLEHHEAEYLEFYQWGWDPALIQSAGFCLRDPSSSLVVPTYFEPYEAKNIALDFAYWVDKSAPAPFLIFKGDADQDRPN